MRPQRSTPGSALRAVRGTVIGMVVALLCFSLIWLWTAPVVALNEYVRYFTQVAPQDVLFVWSLVFGGLAGYIVDGSAAGHRGAYQTGRFLGVAFMTALGAAIGAGVGVVLFVAFLMAWNPGTSLPEAMAAVPFALADPTQALGAFMVGGAVTGAVVTVYAQATRFTRNAVRNAAGAFLGGIAGLVIYVLAYLLINHPGLPETPEYVVHVAEGIYSATIVEFGLIALGAAVGAITARYSWRLYGVFTLTALLCVVFGYLLYTLNVTLPRVPPEALWLSFVLFGAELVSLTMVVLYSFYTIDVATRKRWHRTPRSADFSRYYVPHIAFHVASYNEPPELVIESLKTLLAMDYPADRYLVMVGDDSTKPACREPLQAYCEANGIVYNHRDDRTGFKAGALNKLLAITPADVDLIAVIDADYQVEPEFLSDIAGYFIDPDLAWLQTPQDYRNESQSFLTKQYYLADKYFYRTVLPSRNEENSIIFCGTMGVLRAQALREVGGWGEKYITEDAELSVRLLSGGWNSLYVNRTYGRGLIPATFDGYRKQHARWALGGGQVLRGHFFKIFFGRFSLRQRFDYMVGNMHWFEGLFIFTIALVLLWMGGGDLANSQLLTHHSHEILLIGLVPFFLIVDGFTRLHMVLRRSLHVTIGGTTRILGMWFAVKFSNAIAALKGFLGFRTPFIRTSKSSEGRLDAGAALQRAIRSTRLETVMAILSFLTSIALFAKNFWFQSPDEPAYVARIYLAFWLLYYALMFASAPIYAYRAHRTFTPTAPSTTFATRIQSVTP